MLSGAAGGATSAAGFPGSPRVSMFRMMAAAFVVWTGCLSLTATIASTLLAEAIVEHAAPPLTLPVELGAALSGLPLEPPAPAAGG
jgi:hypothetical protein